MSQPRRYALVIFDFDGTLADSADWFAEVFNGVARRYHFKEATPDDLQALRGEDARGVLKRLGVARWKLPLIARHMRRLMARDIERIRLFPGVEAALGRLHEAGVMLAIVSSNSRENICRVLGTETAALIDQFACGSSMFGKAAKFRLVLKRTGVAADRAIAIGDEVRDIDAAEAVALASGAVAWGYADPAALRARRPTILFERIDAIPCFVLAG